jgi:septal ring factor EnvC (AmiA/AmiB activator)
MRSGPRRPIATTATALALACLFGCTQTGPLTARRSTLGTLRTSVAQLQHENEQLKREVADLQVENRRVADKLDESEQTNGDLTARLDDAKAAIKGDGSILADTAPPATSGQRREGRHTAPAGRSSRTPRRPPFARIPSRIEDASADDADPPAEPPRDDLGPQSRLDGPVRWLPVGPGATAIR